MISDILKNIGVNGSFEREESFLFFRLKCNFITFDIRYLEIIKKFLNKLPLRDRFELRFERDGDSPSAIHSPADATFNDLRQWIQEDSDFERISFALEITKTISDGNISVYDYEIFFQFIESKPAHFLLTWFNTNFINKLSFEVFDESIESFGSQTIAFVKYGDIYNFSENYKREKIRYNIKLSCHVIGISSTVLPSDFFLRSQWNKCCIPQIFNTLCNLLSLAYLADYAELTLENKLIFAFHGYKIIKGEWQVEQCGAFDFYKFFHFSFESDNSSDKLGVVRNIFSLHSSSDGILQPSDACYQAILSNYNIYLKKNVEQYLKLKDSISDYILQSLSKTNGLIDSYISSFRNNVITVFSFFISIVIVNGLKDHGIHNLISFDVFVVLLCLLILSVLWLRMSHSDIVSRYNYTLETLQHNLNVSYSAILCSEELASSLEPFLSQNKFFFENRIKQYTIYWTAVLVVTFSVFCIGLYYKKFDTICNWFSTFWQ